MYSVFAFQKRNSSEMSNQTQHKCLTLASQPMLQFPWLNKWDQATITVPKYKNIQIEYKNEQLFYRHRTPYEQCEQLNKAWNKPSWLLGRLNIPLLSYDYNQNEMA